LIAAAYPKGEGAGRLPVGLERMLRIDCLQHWFNLSDPAVEEALYDSRAMREFVGIDLGREPVPDETTICKFRHLLEAHDLGPQILATVNAHLAEQGFKVSTGTIVDATIISAPSSTKNHDGERDPQMHQPKKGNEWHFGIKAHIGVDSRHKSRVRAKVEHPFPVLKVIFGFRKVRYRGLAKNAQRLTVACALVNLFMLRRPLRNDFRAVRACNESRSLHEPC
jgi:IS5 family transposase